MGLARDWSRAEVAPFGSVDAVGAELAIDRGGVGEELAGEHGAATGAAIRLVPAMGANDLLLPFTRGSGSGDPVSAPRRSSTPCASGRRALAFVAERARVGMIPETAAADVSAESTALGRLEALCAIGPAEMLESVHEGAAAAGTFRHIGMARLARMGAILPLDVAAGDDLSAVATLKARFHQRAWANRKRAIARNTRHTPAMTADQARVALLLVGETSVTAKC